MSDKDNGIEIPENLINCCLLLIFKESLDKKSIFAAVTEVDMFTYGRGKKIIGCKDLKLFISSNYELRLGQEESSLPVFYVLFSGDILAGFEVCGVYSSKGLAELAATSDVIKPGNYVITPILAVRSQDCEKIVIDDHNKINVNDAIEQLLR